MASSAEDKSPQTVQTLPAESTGFGAYGAGVNPQKNLAGALDNPSQSKVNDSLDFADHKKRWLKDYGITTTDPNSFHAAWRTEEEKHHHEHRKWSDSMGGRLGMRTISRGVVGVAVYTLAQMHSLKALRHYSYISGAEKNNSATSGLLQHVARFIDRSAGEGIQSAARFFGKSEEEARNLVTFRDTRDYGYKNREDKLVHGRSLGAEAVSITFDFASMSFGDYMTRYVFTLMDPNAQKHWFKDGHLDIPAGLKELFKNVFRGVTYAAGEDMAVALPYVYCMRAHRKLIDHYSPGFKYDTDLGLNGGSYKLGPVKTPEGTTVKKVTGDYQLEGMLDLVGRFSWYNVGTKMFRDAYSRIASAFDDWRKGDHRIHAPHIEPENFTPKNIGLAVAHGIRYVLRTTLKVMGYMLPAAFTFALLRSSPSKTRGVAIDPELGVLGRDDAGGKFRPVTPNSVNDKGFKLEDMDKLYFSGNKTLGTVKHYPFTGDRGDAFNAEFYKGTSQAPSVYTTATNPIGRKAYKAGTVLTERFNRGNDWLKKHNITPDFLSPRNIEDFARTSVNAMFAYPIYVMMKSDVLSAEWDTTRTDMGIDRSLNGLGTALTGLVTFNGQKIRMGMGGFVAGLGEARRSMMREPFTDPRREEIAQREHWYADPEHASNEGFQLNGISHRVRHMDDKTGKPYAHEGLKAKPVIPSTFTSLKTPSSWAAQVAAREFQETSSPQQGQSVH